MIEVRVLPITCRLSGYIQNTMLKVSLLYVHICKTLNKEAFVQLQIKERHAVPNHMGHLVC